VCSTVRVDGGRSPLAWQDRRKEINDGGKCRQVNGAVSIIVGKLCQFIVVVCLTVYLRRCAAYIFVAVIVLYTWAAWYNVWGCELYYPRLLDWRNRLP